jgi:hypothetical protein
MVDKIDKAFDPKAFLAKVGEGRSILEFRKDEVIFAQATWRLSAGNATTASQMRSPRTR